MRHSLRVKHSGICKELSNEQNRHTHTPMKQSLEEEIYVIAKPTQSHNTC